MRCTSLFTRRRLRTITLTAFAVLPILMFSPAALGAGAEPRVQGFPIHSLSDNTIGGSKAELLAQIKHSDDVVQFFQKGKGSWHLMLCEPRMLEMGVCLEIRQKISAHVWLQNVAHGKLAAVREAERKAALIAKAQADPWAAIDLVFGQYASQANTVVTCESGYSTSAQNGQYLGMFQMGENERATYGHGSDALTQTRAAYAYFVASGKDWSPWQCKP